MNREIKFRGISIDEWVYGMLCKVNEGDTEHGEPIKYKIQTDEKEYGEYVKCFITDENTIGQYTGLKDKNGKEIYEGDVVLLTCYNYEEPVFGGEFKVIYDDINGMWILVDLENKDMGFTFGEIRSYYKAEFEVIGNVFEKGILLNDSEKSKKN